jgi:hypothetical protein
LCYKIMKINKEWHLNNKIPKNPTTDQRVKWHLEHAINCQCRPIDRTVLEKISKRIEGLEREGVWDEKLLQMTKGLATKHHKTSAIFLQRKLTIDFERAMNLMEKLEKERVLGQETGLVKK